MVCRITSMPTNICPNACAARTVEQARGPSTVRDVLQVRSGGTLGPSVVVAAAALRLSRVVPVRAGALRSCQGSCAPAGGGGHPRAEGSYRGSSGSSAGTRAATVPCNCTDGGYAVFVAAHSCCCLPGLRQARACRRSADAGSPCGAAVIGCQLCLCCCYSCCGRRGSAQHLSTGCTCAPFQP